MEMRIVSSFILVKLSCQLRVTSNLASNIMGALTRDRFQLLEQESRTKRSSTAATMHKQGRDMKYLYLESIHVVSLMISISSLLGIKGLAYPYYCKALKTESVEAKRLPSLNHNSKKH
jgi:hypothetical protein